MADPTAPGSFTAPIPPLAAFGGSPLYVTGEDALCATILNAAAGVTVTITGRMLEFGQSRPSPFSQTIIPATDRSASVVRFTIGDGWLLNAQAIVTAGTPATGQTFVRLSLVRGITSNAIDLFTLAANYATAKMPVSYPGSPVLSSTEGCGALRSITGAVPAAGGEISETVPTGARWELLSIATQLVASATVATRNSILTLDDAATVYGRFPMNNAQGAGTTFAITWGQGQAFINGEPSQGITASIPVNVKLAAGHRIRTSTVSIQAADQYSAIQYLVREWIEGA